ncbi:MAG: hypothetical protein WC440_00900 [Candidatus Omnitrophota bacterium]
MDSDRQSVFGLGSLVNPAYADASATNTESQIIRGLAQQTPARNSSDILKEKMDEIEGRLGFRIFDDSQQASTSTRTSTGTGTSTSTHSDEHARYAGDSDERPGDDGIDMSASAQTQYLPMQQPQQSRAQTDPEPIRERTVDEYRDVPRASDSDGYRAIPMSNEGMRFTDEEMKRGRVMNALSALRIGADGFLDSDREHDMKVSAIEEIEDLVALFKDNGEDVSHIHVPTIDESLEIIQSTLTLLKRHNDRRRFGSVADDCIMMAASGLEYLFDGNRSFFGFKPNLSGWKSHVRTKLRRMRHDTSQIASSLMNDYNFGPISRLIIELVPSMIMYAGQHSGGGARQEEHTAEADFDSAIDRLRTK